jgi:mono/diheme cytochrome c family protein
MRLILHTFARSFLLPACLLSAAFVLPGKAQEAESEAIDSAQDARLLTEVRGIFAHHCYKCHSSDKMKGDLRLDTKEGIFAGGESGAALVPGSPSESEILHRVLLPTDDDDAMPPEGDRLTAEQTEILRNWIAAGARWPDVQAGTFRRAPLALTKPPVPDAKVRSKNPIDAFVARSFAQRETKKQWPKLVSDELFLRRIYLDVIGLLPNYREVSRFKRNKDPEKYSHIVKELLDRDIDYALHWMTFWNDALRNDYAGTGYIDGGRTQISDWLYQSLVANKRYDQFTHELISPVSGSKGFINGINWRGSVNASQVKEMQAAQSLSQVFLGLNLKCASCHDSFINDWKLADAYALANIFADQPMEIHRCDQATGKIAKTQFLFPELGTVAVDASKSERMKQLADLVIADGNGRTPRTIVNRLWARFLGRGIVEPVDEMDLQPWDGELLDWLAADLVENDYDLKHTIHQILSSHAYRLRSVVIDDPNALTSDDFAFNGPVRRRLSAEQFADAVSEKISPLFASADFQPPVEATVDVPELPDSINRSKWVWLAGDEGATAAEPGTVYFRKTVRPSFARTILKGEIFLTADNAFELSANGEVIGKGDNWKQLHYAEITDAFKNRKLDLEVKVTNTGDSKNPAGLFGLVVVTYLNQEKKEERLMIPSYGSWRSSRTQDGEFERSDEVVTAKNEHAWSAVSETIPMDTGFPGNFIRAVAVKNNPFLTALGRPVRDTISTGRISEATLLEALELTNGTFLDDALKKGAEALCERSRNRTSTIVQRIYREFLGRTATENERRTIERKLGGTKTTPEAVQDLLWAILVSPEFQIIY